MFRNLLSACLVMTHLASAIAAERSVAASAKDASPLKVGDAIPDVTVTDSSGSAVKLSQFHAKRPLVIVFFRGSWCPFCSRHFQELVKVYPEIEKLNANVIAISPDTVEASNENTAKLKLPFPVVSESDASVAKAFGLAFKVDDETLTKYKGFGIDLEKASGKNHHILPVPAVYILDKSGTIRFAHSDPDYRKRLDAQTIPSELKKIE